MGGKNKFISLWFKNLIVYQLLCLIVDCKSTICPEVKVYYLIGVGFFKSLWSQANIIHSKITSAVEGWVLKEISHA